AKLHNYQRKFSGPILDRIDLYIPVDHIEHKKLLQKPPDHTPDELAREKVLGAVKRQHDRFGQVKYNSQLDNKEVKKFGRLTPEALKILNQGSRQLGLSPRAYIRT